MKKLGFLLLAAATGCAHAPPYTWNGKDDDKTYQATARIIHKKMWPSGFCHLWFVTRNGKLLTKTHLGNREECKLLKEDDLVLIEIYEWTESSPSPVNEDLQLHKLNLLP